MYLRDACDNCDSSADVGIEEDDNVRLSLRVWTCKICGHQTVTAFDWERGEMTSAEIFDAKAEALAKKKKKLVDWVRRQQEREGR